MSTQQTEIERTAQVELVDNWHPRWREVLDAIENLGLRGSLQIDEDGWLSARHNLLVAFMDDGVAGHLSFRVQPVSGEATTVSDQAGRLRVEAQLESIGVQSGFTREHVESLLRTAAERRAMALGCQRFVGS